MYKYKMESQTSSFNDELTVHPWDRLVAHLVGWLDDDSYQTLLQLTFTKMNIHNITCKEEYFTRLKDKLGEHEVVTFLKNVMGQMNFHGEHGLLKYEELLESFSREFREATIEKTFKNSIQCRNRERKSITNILRQSEIRGVIICGTPGEGKTTLAEEVCTWFSAFLDWKTIAVNMREVREIEDILQLISREISKELDSLSKELGSLQARIPALDMLARLSPSELTWQLQTLVNTLDEYRSDYVILLDDLDSFISTTDNNTVTAFLDKLLTVSSKFKGGKLKYIMTCAHLKKSDDVDWQSMLHGQIARVKLQSLSTHDKLEWLNKHTSSGKNLERLTNDNSSIMDMIFMKNVLLTCHLSNQDDMMTVYLNEQRKYLPETNKHTYLDILSSLTVFQTSFFDVEAASSVFPQSLELGTRQVDQVLLTLHSDLWLELNRLSSTGEKNSEQQSKVYSFHPKVYKFLKFVCEQEDQLKPIVGHAERKFVEYMYNVITKVKKPISTPSMIKAVNLKLVHVLHFYQLLSGPVFSLLDVLHLDVDPCRFLPLKTIWMIALNRLTSTKLKEFLHWNVLKAKETKDLYLFVYLRVFQAECLVEEDKFTEAMEVIEECFNVYRGTDGITTGWYKHEADKGMAKYMLLTSELEINFQTGLITGDRTKFELALEFVEKCLNHLKRFIGCTFYKSEKVILDNKLGRIYSQLGQLDKAIKCLEKVLKQAKPPKYYLKLTKCRENLAGAYLQKEGQYVRKAVDLLTECISDDYFGNQVNLQLRSEAYYKLCDENKDKEVEYLNKALKDGREALKIVCNRDLEAKEVLNALEKVARHRYSLGRAMDKDSDRRKNLLDKSRGEYERILTMIEQGILAVQVADKASIHTTILSQVTQNFNDWHDYFEEMLGFLINGRLEDMKQSEDYDEEDFNIAYNYILKISRTIVVELSANAFYKIIKEKHLGVISQLNTEFSLCSTDDLQNTEQRYEAVETAAIEKEFATYKAAPNNMSDIDTEQTQLTKGVSDEIVKMDETELEEIIEADNTPKKEKALDKGDIEMKSENSEANTDRGTGEESELTNKNNKNEMKEVMEDKLEPMEENERDTNNDTGSEESDVKFRRERIEEPQKQPSLEDEVFSEIASGDVVRRPRRGRALFRQLGMDLPKEKTSMRQDETTTNNWIKPHGQHSFTNSFEKNVHIGNLDREDNTNLGSKTGDENYVNVFHQAIVENVAEDSSKDKNDLASISHKIIEHGSLDVKLEGTEYDRTFPGKVKGHDEHNAELKNEQRDSAISVTSFSSEVFENDAVLIRNEKVQSTTSMDSGYGGWSVGSTSELVETPRRRSVNWRNPKPHFMSQDSISEYSKSCSSHERSNEIKLPNEKGELDVVSSHEIKKEVQVDTSIIIEPGRQYTTSSKLDQGILESSNPLIKLTEPSDTSDLLVTAGKRVSRKRRSSNFHESMPGRPLPSFTSQDSVTREVDLFALELDDEGDDVQKKIAKTDLIEENME